MMLLITLLALLVISVESFRCHTRKLSLTPLKMSFDLPPFLLADTSISEEEVLDVVGQAADLPDPIWAVGVAAVIFVGVGILQFSLGDLTKEVRC